MPVLTLQKAQARVQVSPRIITVACFLVQHSPILGQAASSQTVARLSRRISSLVSMKPALTGALTRIQSGLRWRGTLDGVGFAHGAQIAILGAHLPPLPSSP